MATHGFPGITASGHYTCDVCDDVATRVLTDSWTGKDLCFECAHIAAWHVTQSPDEEGDNLVKALREHGRVPESVDA